MMKGFNNIDKKKYENYYKKYLDLTTSKHKKGNYSKKKDLNNVFKLKITKGLSQQTQKKEQ